MPILASFSFGTGTDTALGTGTAEDTVEMPAFDWSRRQYLQMVVELEAAGVDAGDILEVYLEERAQDGKWNQRIRSEDFLGTLSPSASAPEVRRYTIVQDETLSGMEEAQEPTGSAGASSLTAGTVVNGPFPPRYRSAGAGTLTAWRVRFSQTNTSTADADFAGQIVIYGGPEFN